MERYQVRIKGGLYWYHSTKPELAEVIDDWGSNSKWDEWGDPDNRIKMGHPILTAHLQPKKVV